jgi:hypothetical protein
MDETDARGHLLKWLREEAGVRPEVVAGLEKKLAEQEVFDVHMTCGPAAGGRRPRDGLR